MLKEKMKNCKENKDVLLIWSNPVFLYVKQETMSWKKLSFTEIWIAENYILIYKEKHKMVVNHWKYV